MLKGIILFFSKEDDLLDTDYSIFRLLEAGRAKNIEMRVVAPKQIELILAPKKTCLIEDGAPMELPDFVIPRMGSATDFHTIAVIRQLEFLGVYVCNNAESIAGVQDKLLMHQLLMQNNLPTPKTAFAKFPVDKNLIEKEIGFPLVIKNVISTQGNGICMCHDKEQLVDIAELISINNKDSHLILQQFLPQSKGQDLRIFVVGGEVIGCMYRSSSKSFKANYSRGGEIKNFDVTPEIERLALETAELFQLNIVGVDLLFTGGGFMICEANSAPGFVGMEQITGKIIAEKIIDHILTKV